MSMKAIQSAQVLYDEVRKWFAIVTIGLPAILAVFDAPFGRFTSDSIFNVDGITAWIVMELPSPLSFLYALYKAPLSTVPFDWNPNRNPAALLAAFFVTHYLNRAIISPLRTPSRSKSHIIVPIAAIIFNLVNGPLMGTYLSSPLAREYLTNAYSRPIFWIGLGLAIVGLAGNILHDEILLDIRRKANSKGKSKESNGTSASKKEHYAIPRGFLFEYVSYPNYLCEWIEWLGFALAASPAPIFATTLMQGKGWDTVLATITPPWLFLSAEFFTMFPRAIRGHQWYHKTFSDYPKNRKAVIIGLI